MKCIICKNGDLQEGTTLVSLKQDTTILVFQDVPALVCDQCGEAYIDDGVSRHLQQILEEKAQKGQEPTFVSYVA
jgi:YgiT-type zinc finger domain-containing protein